MICKTIADVHRSEKDPAYPLRKFQPLQWLEPEEPTPAAPARAVVSHISDAFHGLERHRGGGKT